MVFERHKPWETDTVVFRYDLWLFIVYWRELGMPALPFTDLSRVTLAGPGQADTMWHITIIAACIPRPLIGGCHHLPPPIAHKTSTNNGVGDRITQRNVGTIMDSGGNEAVLTIDCCLFALIVWVWHRLIDTSHYNDTREQDIRRR